MATARVLDPLALPHSDFELSTVLRLYVDRSIRKNTNPGRAVYCRWSYIPYSTDIILWITSKHTPFMQSCRLPIELWEAIMDVLPDYLGGTDGQRALYACALTCRAWRVRAQHLLWKFPRIVKGHNLSLFTAAIRTAPMELPTTTLVLENPNNVGADLDLKSAGELFIQPFPHLQLLRCTGIRFDGGPPLQALRMRLPFFANIAALWLRGCSFHTPRVFLDVVWACPNLSSLHADGCSTFLRRFPPGPLHLTTTCEHLRACRKLTYLKLDSLILKTRRSSIEHSALRGSVFGHAITELQICVDDPKVLCSFLRDSFPALRSIIVFPSSMRSFPFGLPWLHAIATSRAALPRSLRTVIDQRHHEAAGHLCCQWIIGTGEEVVDFPLRLPELLSGLEQLTIRIERSDEPPEACASYIHSLLPSMQKVLRFEYRSRVWFDWKEYTLPVTTCFS